MNITLAKTWKLISLVCFAALITSPVATYGDSTAEDGIISISVNPGNSENPLGLYSWRTNGINHLNQQWFWYRIGETGPDLSLDHLTLTTEEVVNKCRLELVYTGDIGVSILYGISSEPYGNGTSAIEQRVTITNNTTGTMDLTWFLYTKLNLASTPQDDLAYFSPSLVFDQKNWDALIQVEGGSVGAVLSESPASAYELDFMPNILDSLNDDSPTSLTNTPPAGNPIGPGDIAHCFEYNLSIPSGESVEMYYVNVYVPEPATFLLLGLGTLTLLRKRRA